MAVTPQTDLPVTIEDINPNVPDSGTEINAESVMDNFEALRDGLNEHDHDQLALFTVTDNVDDGQIEFAPVGEDGIALTNGNTQLIVSGGGIALYTDADAGGAYIQLQSDGLVRFSDNNGGTFESSQGTVVLAADSSKSFSMVGGGCGIAGEHAYGLTVNGGTHGIKMLGKIKFFVDDFTDDGVTQPAHPTTLPEVIAALVSLGLVAAS